MQKTFKTLAALFVMTVTVVCLQTNAFASGMGFSVSPVWPENQSSEQGYFDLKVEPGQQQDIAVVVENTSNEEIAVSVEVVTTSTNRNGFADYTSTDGLIDETIPIRMEDVATVRESYLTIPANGSAEVVISLNLPDVEFDGVLLGGVNILKDLTEAERNSGSTILNQYRYLVALRLFQNENEVAPNFEMGETGIELVNYRASFAAYIRNTQPLLVKNVTVTAEIYATGSDEPITQFEKENVEIAPNSIYPLYLVDDEGAGIRAGDYNATIRLSYEGQTWEFEESFTVAAAEAASVNEQARNQNEGGTAASTSLPLWAIIAIIAGGILFILVVILLIFMMRRMNKMSNAMYPIPTVPPAAPPTDIPPTATPSATATPTSGPTTAYQQPSAAVPPVQSETPAPAQDVPPAVPPAQPGEAGYGSEPGPSNPQSPTENGPRQ